MTGYYFISRTDRGYLQFRKMYPTISVNARDAELPGALSDMIAHGRIILKERKLQIQTCFSQTIPFTYARILHLALTCH
jgi:hypothetical protein